MGSTVVIIPAAGRGQRFGGSPKQYRSVAGRPVLWHTLTALQACDGVDAVVVAIHPDDEAAYAAAVDDAALTKLRPPVHGGAARADSVAAALARLPATDDLVLVHDAVRPWVSADLVQRVVEAARRHGAAIPVVPVTETVKVVDAGVVIDTPRRDRLHRAQTPQGFRRPVLEAAYAAAGEGASGATDEASLVEASGAPVHVVEGETRNVKITLPEDLPEDLPAGAPGAAGPGETRVGLGYDVHAFAADRALVLGGVHLEHDVGLAGHSDADVLTHAVIDALLGAARMGDIGRLFPDTDPAFEGIDSLRLLAEVRDRLAAAGAVVVHGDGVVMAQAPKLAPHIATMEARLAQTLGVDAGRVSLKATTTERLGFVGRREGIAAQAVATVRVAPA